MTEKDLMDKIMWEEKWLLNATHAAATPQRQYCIEIAFDAVKHYAKDYIDSQPKAGRWIKQNYGWNWQCSECGFVTPPSAKEIFTFCPNCGAKMEVEDAIL